MFEKRNVSINANLEEKKKRTRCSLLFYHRMYPLHQKRRMEIDPHLTEIKFLALDVIRVNNRI